MRQIGTISGTNEARAFGDYLLTQGIRSRIDADDDGDESSVWIIDEDTVEQAREELAVFLDNPHDARYADSGQIAADLRREADERKKQARKNTVNVRSRWDRPAVRRYPITMALIAISLVVAFDSKLGKVRSGSIDSLSFASFSKAGFYYTLLSPKNDIRRGEVWRIVTPIFIHFNWMHILFNMLMLIQLGGVVETRRGSLRFVLFVLATAAASNFGQYLQAGPTFGGMSGVVYALFGYIWFKGKYDPSSGFYMPPNVVFWLMGWFVLCYAGLIGHVANMAHGVGLISGIVIAIVPVFWKKLT